MISCCAEFEEHCQKVDQDGFVLSCSRFLTPHESRLTLLHYQTGGKAVASLRINFCPWCGHDLAPPKNEGEDSQ